MPVTEITDKEIADIALNQFLKDGIQEFTIKKLTALTGISSKTVYKIFGDKTNLLRICLINHYSQLFKILREKNSKASNPVISFLEILYFIAELEFKVNPKFYADLNKYYPILQDEIIKTNQDAEFLFAQVTDLGIRQGFFENKIDPKIVLVSLQRLYAGITRDRLFEGFNYPIKTLLDNTVYLLIKGMCTPLGVQKLNEFTKHGMHNSQRSP